MQPPYIYIISQVRQVRKIKRDKKISIFNTFKAHFVLQVSNMGFLKEKNREKPYLEAIIENVETSVAIDHVRVFNVDSTFALFLKEKNREKPYLALKVEDITKFQQ